jgi:hypothetical protein
MTKNNNSGWKNYFDFGDVLRYYFRDKREGIKKNFNLKIMHGINRLSILMFVAAIIYLVLKRLI